MATEEAVDDVEENTLLCYCSIFSQREGMSLRYVYLAVEVED